jgi:hypothetical protein
MLAIPLISAKYKRVFSLAKHLLTNPRNCLKADIVEANKCLKSWFGRPQAKAFAKGVNPNVDKQYKEEATAKAAAKEEGKAIGKVDTQASGQQARQEDGQEDKQEDRQEDKQEDRQEDKQEDGQEDEVNEDDVVEYTILDD